MLGIGDLSRVSDGGDVDGCAAGTADCNAKADDGCETKTRTDPANCGGCGQACAPSFKCASANCLCNVDDDCTNGGTCDVGRCTCSGKKCETGVPCNAQGKCAS